MWSHIYRYAGGRMDPAFDPVTIDPFIRPLYVSEPDDEL
jgi:hypothetical protein